MQIERIKRLVKVAKGEIPADLVILNGDLINVYSGEILSGFSIAIKDERIACIGKDVSYCIGDKTCIIHADGMSIIPGLIDSHTHLLMYSPVHEVIKYAIKGGTTTIVSEAIELVFPYGIFGITDFLNWIKNQPIRILITIPAIHSISPLGQKKVINLKDFRALLGIDNILGLGETIWSSILNEDMRIISLISETLEMGKLIEGHGAGAKGKYLCSFVASGISSCHESVSTEDIIERLRLGLYAMIREGDIRKELDSISNIKNMNLDFRRIILVSDGVAPNTLIKHGYMNYILQKAINKGFDPIKAIQMVTINPAEHFKLDHLIGGIAPHRYADIVIIPDLKNIKPIYVISNGKLLLKEEKILQEPRIPKYRKEPFPSINIPKLTPADFVISTKKDGMVKVRVINLVSPLVTKELLWNLPINNGQVLLDLDEDILKIAALTKSNHTIDKFVGFIKGFGLKKGAFATSAVWDACLIIVVGTNENDMANAVNRVLEIGGGIAISEGGQIVVELNMPIGGVIADMPINKIAKYMHDIQIKLESFGCSLPDAHLTLSTLTTPYIPFIKISEKGMFDIKACTFVSLFPD